MTLGFTLVGSIRSKTDEAGLGKHTSVVGGRLFLDGGPRMSDDDSCAVAVRCVGRRMVEMTGKFQVTGEEGEVCSPDEFDYL